MRKRLIPSTSQPWPLGRNWLDLEKLASVEVTSEDSKHPIESALLPSEAPGWRATKPGEQTIRLCFDNPQRIRRIWLDFEEPLTRRTQEFVLRWSSDGGQSYREIVRQGWNFSPPESIREIEDYVIELDGVTTLELSIVPDKSGGEARASLMGFRLRT
jgi:hypothetical protein